MFFLAPPEVRETRLFTRLPDGFRRTGVRSDWAAANRSGLPTDAFLEGPVFDSAGNLFVCDIPFGRVFRIDPAGARSPAAIVRPSTRRRPARSAARRRLRPVLTTASIAAFGLVPLPTASGPGSEIQRLLAIVVVGGLVSSTLLTRIILPILYRYVAGSRPARAAAGPAERVRGRSGRAHLQVAPAHDDARSPVGALQAAFPIPEVAYWITPVIEFGRFA